MTGQVRQAAQKALSLGRIAGDWLLGFDIIRHLKTLLGWRVIAFICALLVLVGYILGVITTYNLTLEILEAHQ